MNRLRLAVQKSGRLSEDSLSLLEECGIDIASSRSGGRLKAEATNFPLELLFLRDDDIPGYVADGVADCGIVGENVFLEAGQPVVLVDRLGFSRCRLSLAIPRGAQANQLSDLEGKKIATSYPRILSDYLRQAGVSAAIHEISGSVEIAPSIGLADAVCDIVGSGSTLISNGLVELETILRSEAVLIAHSKLGSDKLGGDAARELTVGANIVQEPGKLPERSSPDTDSPPSCKILEQLRFRIQSVKRARHSKYILLNAPNQSIDKIIKLLPGIKSPTIVPLAEEGWSSVHSVVDENQFWDVIEKLREAGAQGILVVPIEKIIS